MKTADNKMMYKSIVLAGYLDSGRHEILKKRYFKKWAVNEERLITILCLSNTLCITDELDSALYYMESGAWLGQKY